MPAFVPCWVNLLQVSLPSPSRAQPYSSFFYPVHSTCSHARRQDVAPPAHRAAMAVAMEVCFVPMVEEVRSAIFVAFQ
jgi:hypothetical protein